jgi:hypothetical protein
MTQPAKTQSTIERAYALARSGRYGSVAQIELQLKAEGRRAVDALLAPRSVRGHLQAICAAKTTPSVPADEHASA